MSTAVKTNQPLATFVILGFRQERYIRDAIAGAFAQEYPALEIILSDDCSPDGTFAIMQEMAAAYDGPHRVITRQNPSNLGLAAHVNALFDAAGGDVVLLAAGDDISLPGRTAASVEMLAAHPKAGEVVFSAQNINDAGEVTGVSALTDKDQLVQDASTLLGWRHKTLGAGRAIRKNVFDAFGPLHPDCPTEDTPFLLRSVLSGGSILSRDIQLQYRHHDSNMSAAAGLQKMNIDAIHDQYRRDLATARGAGMLPDDLAGRFDIWMAQDKTIRALRIKLALGQRLGLLERLKVLRLPAFSRRQKLRAALKI